MSDTDIDAPLFGGGLLPYNLNHYYWLRIPGPIIMPCGAEVKLTGKNQLCPNSGKCNQGSKECWVENYDPAKEAAE